MTWTLEIPWMPAVTPNSRRHWSARAQDAKVWRSVVKTLAKTHGFPTLQRVTVTLTMVPKDRRRRDPDNLGLTLKFAIDGLVDAKVIPDDSARYVALCSCAIDLDDAGPARYILTVEAA